MASSSIVWLAVALAFFTQLLLVFHMIRRWPSVPSQIPYGTLPGRYFLWGPRAIAWSTPAAIIVIIAVIAGIIWCTPSLEQQPLMAVPFVLIAVSMPIVQRSIDDKIDAAIQRNS